MNNQWIRKVGLVVFTGEKGLDLSEFRIRFNTQNADVESPNTCIIRVYNLAAETVQKITGEFSQVVLNAGYVNGNYGVIFQGSIKQFKIGRESAIDSYLEIYAADGDLGYNQGVVNTTMAAGTTPAQKVKELAKAMKDMPVDQLNLKTDKQHIPSIRGSVMFGMARARMRNVASTLDASWSIQNGKVFIMDNRGYAEGEAVEINVTTGLIGVPEQTDSGIYIRCLLNSRLRIGGAVKLNNKEINQIQFQNPDAAPVRFNQYSGIQFLAPIDADGIYRAFVVEHEGDSRGQEWYSNLICLAVNPTVAPDQSVSPQ